MCAYKLCERSIRTQIMKHKSHRLFNRLLFIAGIVIPTMIIGGTLMVRHTELGQRWLKGQWIEQLSQATHSRVEIGHIHFIQPGKYTLEDVRIADRESGQLICRANHVQVNQLDEEITLDVHTLQIPNTPPAIWMNWWNEHLLAITESRRLKVSIGLTLLNNLPLEQLDHLAAQVDLTDETSKLTINWGNKQQPFALQLSRNHRHPATTTLLLQTNGNELPLETLAPALPTPLQLGSSATFNGQLISKYAPGQFTSDVDFAAEGVIKQIELNEFFQQPQEQVISGNATLQLKRAICNNNQWKRVSGVITGESGWIARQWLPQLASKLQLRWMGNLQEDQVPFEAIHCEFNWDPSGFTLRGETEGAHVGTILRHPKGPILGDRPDTVIRSATLDDALNR